MELFEKQQMEPIKAPLQADNQILPQPSQFAQPLESMMTGNTGPPVNAYNDFEIPKFEMSDSGGANMMSLNGSSIDDMLNSQEFPSNKAQLPTKFSNLSALAPPPLSVVSRIFYQLA